MGSTITVYPFVLHSLSLSVFSSVIGPFGGFFASGFKRAFKIKVKVYCVLPAKSFYWLFFSFWKYRISVI